MTKNENLLAAFYALPDLLELAHQQRQSPLDNAYQIQDRLRTEYRQNKLPYRYSMPYRHLFNCSMCNYCNTAIKYELENPKVEDLLSPLRTVSIWEENMHYIRAHDADFPENVAAFLKELMRR